MQSERFRIAVEVLTHLAVTDPDPATPADPSEPSGGTDAIALLFGKRPTELRRAIAPLKEAGLVHSRPGPGGGIRLTRRPTRITLEDVYLAVVRTDPWGNIESSGRRRRSRWSRHAIESLGPVLDRVREALREALRQTTIAVLATRIQQAQRRELLARRRRGPHRTDRRLPPSPRESTTMGGPDRTSG